MGIYYDGKVYGIRIMKDDNSVVFERTYPTQMTTSQLKEAEDLYKKLTPQEKEDIYFAIYTPCTTSYDIHVDDTYMSWIPWSVKFIDNVFKTSKTN